MKNTDSEIDEFLEHPDLIHYFRWVHDELFRDPGEELAYPVEESQ